MGGWYSLTLAGETSTHVVFNDGGSRQSVDLSRGRVGWYLPMGVNWQDKLVGRWYDRNPDRLPWVGVDPPGGSIYETRLGVTVSFAGGTVHTARYTLDGSDPATGGTSFTSPAVVPVGNGLGIGQSATLRVFVANADGSAAAQHVFTRREPRPVKPWNTRDRPEALVGNGRWVLLERFNNRQGLPARNVKIYLRADGPSQPRESTRRWTSVLLSAFGSDAWRQ